MAEPVLDLTLRPDVEDALHAMLDIGEAHTRHLRAGATFEEGYALGSAANTDLLAVAVAAYGEDTLRLVGEALIWMRKNAGKSCRMLADGTLEEVVAL